MRESSILLMQYKLHFQFDLILVVVKYNEFTYKTSIAFFTFEVSASTMRMSLSAASFFFCNSTSCVASLAFRSSTFGKEMHLRSLTVAPKDNFFLNAESFLYNTYSASITTCSEVLHTCCQLVSMFLWQLCISHQRSHILWPCVLPGTYPFNIGNTRR